MTFFTHCVLVMPYNEWVILTHWGRVTHICVGNLTIIGSNNRLSPGRLQAIIWTNAGILLIGPLGTNFSEIFAEITTFSFIFVQENVFESVVCEMAAILSQSHCVNSLFQTADIRVHVVHINHVIITWRYRSESTLAQVMASLGA